MCNDGEKLQNCKIFPNWDRTDNIFASDLGDQFQKNLEKNRSAFPWIEIIWQRNKKGNFVKQRHAKEGLFTTLYEKPQNT